MLLGGLNQSTPPCRLGTSAGPFYLNWNYGTLKQSIDEYGTAFLFNRSLFTLLLVVLCFSPTTFCQETDAFDIESVFSLKLTPGLGIPLDPNTDIFMLGGGADLTAQYQIPLISTLDLDLQAEVGYYFTPIQALVPDTTISHLSVAVGGGISWTFAPRFILGAYGRAGYFYSFLNDTSKLDLNSSAQTGGGEAFFSEEAQPLPSCFSRLSE